MRALSILAIVSVMLLGQACNENQNSVNMNILKKSEHYTFQLSDKVTRQKVTFKNRYGIILSGDLYIPKNRQSGSLPAIVISGPFGAVKEQSSGLYANQMAERGFVALHLTHHTQERAVGNPDM